MKTVLVTGGSRGIGKCLVENLAKTGYNVILNYNNSEEEAKKIQKNLQEDGYNIEIYKADVSKRENVKKLVDFCVKKFEKIDVLINNAGISQIKLFTDITDDDWEKMININLTSVFMVSQEVVKYMINKKDGCIINISSMWGVVGASCETHYSASKSGVNGLTKAMAKELGLSNIRVNAIAPGVIDTDMNKNIGEETLDMLKEEIPLNKIGQPEDIYNCVKWLIEDKYTTGQIISVNGGMVI